MNKKFLSTGQVAKEFSVTPDTVLKWIKSNKLYAHRTAGGHYRIAEEDLNSFRDKKTTTGIDATCIDSENNLYCWEFMENKGLSTTKCKDCIVYNTQTKKCYKLATLPEEIGHQRTFCNKQCSVCEYFKTIVHTPSVLIITENNNLINYLNTNIDKEKCELSFCNHEILKSKIPQHADSYILIDYDLMKNKHNKS